MANIGDEIKKARLAKGISIQELSQATSIRSHIIQSIESGEPANLPDIYIKSFTKKLCEYLEIDITDQPASSADSEKASYRDDAKPEISSSPQTKNNIAQEKPANENAEDIASNAKIKFDNEQQGSDEAPPESKPAQRKKEKPTKKSEKLPIQSNPKIEISSDYSEIFKKKKVSTGINPSLINYLVYAGVALIIVVTIYFTFFFDSSNYFHKQSYQEAAKDTSQTESENSLLEYFATADSLTLQAKARDSAWLKIEIDGLRSEEVYMLPGMEKTWNAAEFFTINQGNVGAIKFYRNGELLEPFGKRGSIVRNIKITRDDVLNVSPWKNDPTSEFGAIKEVPKETKRYSGNNKQKQQERQRLLEPSNLPLQKPSLLNDTSRRRSN